MVATPHKKSLVRALPSIDKMESPFFVADKNIVAKDVGNGGYLEPAKYGAKISKVYLFKIQNPSSIPLNPCSLARSR
jgi:hypothetical protein